MSPQFVFKNQILRHVSMYKYLRIRVDDSLSWKIHRKQMKQTCNKSLNLLKLLSHKKWGADRASLLKLHLALIKRKLDYGYEAYSSACNTYLD